MEALDGEQPTVDALELEIEELKSLVGKYRDLVASTISRIDVMVNQLHEENYYYK